MISASGVSLSIAGRRLLGDLDFTINSGELIAVLGPNGVGKTTLLRAIAGLHPAQGTLRVNGLTVAELSPAARAREMAMMVSEDVAVESMSVRDAVAAGRYAHHRWWDWREHDSDAAVIDQALVAVHMSDFSQRDFETLSTGERQRVWLALGLAQEAPVLLLDEPTSHLDIRVSQEMLRLLVIQARAGKTIVCVLHDMNEALQFADRIMVLGREKMLAFDTPQAVVNAKALDAAYGIALEATQSRDGVLRVFAGP